jgi:hypothetical protein
METSSAPTVGAGREPAAAAVRAWLTDVLRPRLCVVTGQPGTGKTHLTAWTALNDLGAERSVQCMVSARGLTLHSLAWALAEQFTVAGGTPDEVVARIAADRRRATIIVSELDEAGPGCDGAAAPELIAGLLVPLLEFPHIRLLVEGRPETLAAFTVPAEVVHLDSPELCDRAAFTAWLRATAAGQGLNDPAAIAFAETLFPNVGMAALALRTGPPAGTVENAGNVVDRWLGTVPQQARPALEALAAAYAPISYETWHHWTTALSGDPGRARDSITAAAPLVTNRDETFLIGCRPLREAILGRRPPELAGQIDNSLGYALFTAVPKDQAGAPRWEQSPPYATAHLLRHAAVTGVADRLLADAGQFVHADPRTVTAVLESATGDFAVRLWAVWRSVGRGLLSAQDAGERAALLRLAALVRHDQPLADWFAPHAAEAWTPAWLGVRPPASTTTGRWTGPVSALARGTGDRRAQLLAASADGTLHTVSGGTGAPVGRLAGGTPEIWGVVWFEDGTVLHLDAHGVLRTGGATKVESRADRISSLLNAAPAPTVSASSVLDTVRRGLRATPTALGGDTDLARIVIGDASGTVHVWAPDGPLVSENLHEGPVTAVTCVHGRSGRPSVISGGADGAVRLWTLGEPPVDEPLIRRNTVVSAAAFAAPDSGPVAAVAWNDGEIRIWDLHDGEEAVLNLGLTVNALALDAAGLLTVAGDHGTVAVRLDPSRLFPAPA